MRLLDSWVQTPWAEAVGWSLLHSLWQGAILAAALGALLLATRSPRLRYAAACFTLVLMLAGFALSLFVFPAGGGASAGQAAVIPAPGVRTGPAARGPSDPGLGALVPWLGPFWIAGVWVFAFRHAAGWIQAGRLRRRGVCCAPERWQEALKALSARLRLSRPVVLLESCLADVPVVIGHLRPVILVPAGLLAGLPPGQMEAILIHELAHIRRSDYLANMVQRLLEALMFYHPAVWWVSSVIRAEREKCCDDVVVATSLDRYRYAAALAALEQSRRPETALAATGGTLAGRIRRLLSPERPGGAWAPLLGAALLITASAGALIAWQPRSSQPHPQLAETSPYVKWLEEDVGYIAGDEERAAFRRLASDEEREKFIEQFWRRRDPQPATARNEFKDEHHRRIAYANQRFRISSRPGWQTDRGYIYIVYGPPDEIESYPSGRAGRPNPYEVWLYRNVEGIGDDLTIAFVARPGTDDYRLAPGNARVR